MPSLWNVSNWQNMQSGWSVEGRCCGSSSPHSLQGGLFLTMVPLFCSQTVPMKTINTIPPATSTVGLRMMPALLACSLGLLIQEASGSAVFWRLSRPLRRGLCAEDPLPSISNPHHVAASWVSHLQGILRPLLSLHMTKLLPVPDNNLMRIPRQSDTPPVWPKPKRVNPYYYISQEVMLSF